MKENKLTDEEIVKALENEKEHLLKEEKRTGNAPDTQLVYLTGEAVLGILDLIHRLQDDYSNLKERYVKVLGLNEKLIIKQKAEIERLENERTYLQMVADAFKGDYKNAKADGVRELLQQLIEMEIKLDPLRSGIRYKALVGYAEENGVEVDL